MNDSYGTGQGIDQKRRKKKIQTNNKINGFLSIFLKISSCPIGQRRLFMEVAVKSLGQSRPAGPYRKPTMNLNKFFFSWPAKQLPIHIYMLQYILPALAPNCGAVGNHFGGDTIGSWPFFFLFYYFPANWQREKRKQKEFWLYLDRHWRGRRRWGIEPQEQRSTRSWMAAASCDFGATRACASVNRRWSAKSPELPFYNGKM